MSSSDASMTSFPPRLHVLLARESPYGLVIRRGPSKRVCFVGWDRTRDTFKLGQWLKGRIYERRSDLSPDGKHVIYFASNGVKAWTAISRAPYLKAIGLWTQSHHWNGGGLFEDDSRYWANDGFDSTEVRKPTTLKRIQPGERCMGECLMVYYPRLQRDGWKRVADETRGNQDDVTVFEKDARAGWMLRKVAHASSSDSPAGRGCYWDEHELTNGSETLSFPDWEWADMDGKRIVWAEQGKLFGARLTQRGLDTRHQLHDFSSMLFEEIRAPY